ncbi:MAG: DUF2236 domain-containing protein [Solirubrobacterales bacterium]|nr:DUF2236 domain-containing protein [Solirubrobacterales bacterium]
MTSTIYPSASEIEDILVGPDSITWQRVSDVRLTAAMAHALLLQVAHPTVGAGVRDYSDFEHQPWKRFVGTIDYVTLLVYGGDQAAVAGRRLRELHRRFQGVREDGRRYHALEPDAYAWVHATLIQTYVAGHAHFGTRLTPGETERFYAEYRRLGRLIGVRDRDLPQTWSGFEEYFARMARDELTHTEAVDRVLRSLRRIPPPPGLTHDPIWPTARIPVGRMLRLGAVGLLSPELRDRLGIAWSRRDQAEFGALGLVSRRLTLVLPDSFKVTGPAQLAYRREAIARGPLGPAC